MKLEIKDGLVLRGRFEVIERDNDYISTSWITDECLEVDRDVTVFETYSAALAHMYENALYCMEQHSDLRIKRYHLCF